MRQKKLVFLYFFLLLPLFICAQSQHQLSGTVVDDSDGEPIIGATVMIDGTSIGTTTDFDGHFAIDHIPTGTYSLTVRYISYESLNVTDIEINSQNSKELSLRLREDNYKLSEVVVVAKASKNSEVSMLKAQRASVTVASTVSAQQIQKTQDRDASEVIRRIPGISLIDGKFVMVRGLSQRFNNVWINNAAVASSEADSRAFSFDIIPSSQLDNMMIVKTPVPELPADFSGGFIKIATKDVPDINSFDISLGTSMNTQTHLSPFLLQPGSATDFLGFNSNARQLPGNMNSRMDNFNIDQRTELSKHGFNNNLKLRSFKPIADLRFSASLAHKYTLKNSQSIGLIASLNYTNSYNTKQNMQNNRYGVYDVLSDNPVYTNKYTDNVYSNNVRLGGMLNLTYLMNTNHRIEFKHIFNQLGNSQYTKRTGYQDISSHYDQEMSEYLYTSRMAYNGQLSGDHKFDLNHFDWSLGYSYSNKKQPDRVIINRMQDYFTPGYIGKMGIDQNDIQREFSALNENIYSLSLNYDVNLLNNDFNVLLKAGGYGEYRSRKFQQRSFCYAFNESNLPEGFKFMDDVTDMFTDEYLAADKLFIYERTDNTNSYSANNALGALYVASQMQYAQFKAYYGLRTEYNLRSVTSYTHQNEFFTKTDRHASIYLFPSVNLTYSLGKDHQLRAGYGSSVNRPEFREVSTFSYYDFDLFSIVVGNPNLQDTYIHNVDVRYEWYPSAAEIISVGLFYKHFSNPIEFTYIDAGGTYNYTFENASSANSYGVELELRKNLDFMHLKDFSVSLNATYIYSRVQFDSESLNDNRAMQGQSPYLVNAGLFYQPQKIGMSASLLYNVIGKRLVGIGRSSVSGIGNNNIPDTYEMPRHSLDFNISQKLGKGFELKFSAKDLICNPLKYEQNLVLTNVDGVSMKRTQIVRQYNPGRTFYLSINYKI